MLRAHACVICGDPIPAGRRLDRRYCRVSCRSVAYRARKGGKAGARSPQLAEPDAAPRESRYGGIPREVLDILAKHFGARDEVVRAELTAAQRRATQLQQALDEATAAARPSSEEPQVRLVAAQERIRTLTEALEKSQTESADKYDKLAARYETLNRQKQVATTEQTKHEEALKTLRSELQSAQEKLTQAGDKANAQDKQLADLKRDVEAEKRRASQLDSLATTWERKAMELHAKSTAAEERAQKDADKLSSQTAQLTKLEAKLSEKAQPQPTDPTQGTERAREYEVLQQRVRALQVQVEAQDATKQQLAALRAERDRLLAECASHRERVEQDGSDSVYDAVTANAIQMVRTLLESQQVVAPAVLHEHMQNFGFLIDWSARWFVRQFVRAMLKAESRVQVEKWGMKTALAFIKESQQHPAQFPEGMPEWAEANPALLGQLALCVAGSTTKRVTAAVPAPFQAAMQAAAPSIVPKSAAPSRRTALATAPPRPASEPTQPRGREPAAPAPWPPPAPPPVPAQSAPWPSSAREPELPAASPPLMAPAPFTIDRLVSIKQDLLSVLHQLAEAQDIMGRPITGKRLREGASITEQAQEEAMAERWNYIHNPPPERKTPVFWVRRGELLDPQSERELTDRATEAFVDQSAKLRILELKRKR